jgi:hypothetical protein
VNLIQRRNDQSTCGLLGSHEQPANGAERESVLQHAYHPQRKTLQQQEYRDCQPITRSRIMGVCSNILVSHLTDKNGK